MEVGVDKRGGLGQDSAYGRMMYLVSVFAIAVPLLVWVAWGKINGLMTPKDAKAPQAVASPPRPRWQAGRVRPDQHRRHVRSAAHRSLGIARVVGTIGGKPVLIAPNGLVRMAEDGEPARTQEGYVGDVDGARVSAWSAPVGGRVGRDRLGVDGPGAGLAGTLAGF